MGDGKRQGPSLSASCHGCELYRQERERVQGDTCYDGYCMYSFPSWTEGGKHIGSYSFCAVTPKWCPKLSPTQRDLLFPTTDTDGRDS